MNIDENVVESIVKRVVSQLSTETASAQTCPSGGDWGVFESMNDAVDAAVEAQREYLNRSMHDRACYVQAIRDVVLDQENLEYISRLAVEELQEKYPQRKIYTVDTLCASMGQGLLVWLAAQKRDQGASLRGDRLHPPPHQPHGDHHLQLHRHAGGGERGGVQPPPPGQEGVPAPDSAHQQGPLQGRRARQPGGHRVRPLD